MRLHCPKCTGEIPVDNVNIRALVAKCQECENVFGFDTETVKFSHEIANALKQESVSKPDNMVRKLIDDQLNISWHIKYDGKPVLTVFGILFFLLGLLPILMTLLPGIQTLGKAPIGIAMLIITGLGFGSIALTGLYSIWLGQALRKNVTSLTVDSKQLRVSQSWVPRRQMVKHIDKIAQFYSGVSYKRSNPWARQFDLNIVTTLLTHERIIVGLPSAEHALYLEQEIENFLGITNKPVRGELSRDL